MLEKEQKIHQQRAFSSNPAPSYSNNAYASALKTLQEKLRDVERLNKRSVERPSEIMIDQMKQQICDLQNENERLQFLFKKTNQENSIAISMSQQVEDLQVERIQYLKDYQERVSDLIQKNDELRQEKNQIQTAYDSIYRQLIAYKSNEKRFLHKIELKKFEENATLQAKLKDQKHRLVSHEELKLKLENKIQQLIKERDKALEEVQYYKQKQQRSKKNDYEKEINTLKIQLNEQEKLFQKNIDDALTNRSIKEEQMQNRIQTLINKNNEYQQIIQSMTLDYKDLNLKYQQIKIKQDYQLRNQTQLKRKLSHYEIYSDQKPITKLDMEIMHSQTASQRNSSMEQNQLKQFIRECLEEMKCPSFTDRKHESRKQLLSPMTTQRQNEIETKLQGLNEKYESLIKQAEKEEDLNKKTLLRRQLLEIAEQIKETAKFERN